MSRPDQILVLFTAWELMLCTCPETVLCQVMQKLLYFWFLLLLNFSRDHFQNDVCHPCCSTSAHCPCQQLLGHIKVDWVAGCVFRAEGQNCGTSIHPCNTVLAWDVGCWLRTVSRLKQIGVNFSSLYAVVIWDCCKTLLVPKKLYQDWALTASMVWALNLWSLRI